MKGFRVSGAPEALRLALDKIHVLVPVRGVLVGEQDFEVYTDGALPALSDVTVVSMQLPEATLTGLERDAPIYVGESIVVRPPWVPSPRGFTGVELVVPRAMAFGSGEHGSTRAALMVMEQALGAGTRSLADVGTGSGILALYARARGCEEVAACDIEEASVEAAGQLLPDAQVVAGGPSAIAGRFDCVVANMRAAELLDCLSDLLDLWNRSGPLVLSGLRESEVASVRTAVAAPIVNRASVDGFTALGFRASA